MKRSIRIILAIVLFGSLSLAAQGTSANTFVNNTIIPYQEQVYLKTNTNLSFVGEYLYYTLFNLKSKTGQFSGVSKIGYVKLVDEDGNVVINHKIKLIDGIGDSSFFITSSIPSGNYKLVAYTQWMLNNGMDYFYEQDLTIINPYTSNQSVFRNSNISSSNLEGNLNDASTNTNQPLQLQLESETYGKRESIKLNLTSSGSQEGFGKYAISVRKLDELKGAKNPTILDYQEIYPEERSIPELLLPEMRGELIKGKVTPSGYKNGLNDMQLAASFPGEDYLFKIVSTNDSGEFYLNVDKYYSAKEVYIQPLSNKVDSIDISLIPEKELDFSRLKYHSFKLDGTMEPVIRERSIHNQIENAYYSSKPDTILLGNGNKRFYGPDVTEYILDEYTRFSTVRETFVEVVEHVWLQENKEGQMEFHVRPEAPYVESGQLPLVFVDGVLVLNHELLLNLPSSRINTIHISRKHHFYGTKTFQGIVDISTFKSDYFKNYYTDRLFTKELFKPNENKNYYIQSYKGTLSQNFNRLPDFRYQLLWLPKYLVSKKNQEVAFFSSDISGDFEVVLEGFTISGRPILLTKRFKVQ